MYVEITGYDHNGEKIDTWDKLNSAYVFGGAELLMDTIEHNFDIAVDDYVYVDFFAFIDIVDSIGGIEVDVSDEEAAGMEDPQREQNKYLEQDSDTDLLTHGGKLNLNGNQALAYARTRYGCGDDYGRTMRQRETISKIVSKAKQLSLVELDELMNKVLPEVETDLEEGEIAELLLDAFDYMSYDIQQMRVPADEYYSNGIMYSQSCLLLQPWQFQANAAFLRYIIYGDCKNVDEAVEKYRKEIDDGTFYENNDFEPPVIWY
jgi:LCP family protein required for cell wall assembly